MSQKVDSKVSAVKKDVITVILTTKTTMNGQKTQSSLWGANMVESPMF
jgi:hypothetical protein